MTRKNRKKNKQNLHVLQQNQSVDERDYKSSLNITLADEIDTELLSKWPKLRNKVPAVYLHRPAEFIPHIKSIMSMKIQILPYTAHSNHDKITCATFNDHKMLIQYFENRQLPYHTFGPPSKRKLKVVVKGLPPETDLNKLKRELITIQIPVIRLHKMHTKEYKNKPQPLLVLIVVPYDNEGLNILKLKSISGNEVKLEPPKAKTIQCYRCQKWGHAQRYCHGKIKCVKCAGEHYYTKCERDPEKEELKCANCGENHTANYKQCSYCPDSAKYKSANTMKELKRLGILRALSAL